MTSAGSFIRSCYDLIMRNIRVDSRFFCFYAFFVLGFFFLSTRWIRNYCYVFLAFSVFFILKSGNWRFLFKSKVLKLSLLYCVASLASLFWASEITLLQAADYVRKGFVVFIFLAVTAYVLSRQWEKLESLFLFMCATTSLMALLSSVWFGFLNYDALARVGYRMINIGTLNFPLVAASAYGFVAVVAYFHFFLPRESHIRVKLFSASVVVLAVTFILLTQSRGPLLALAAVLLICTLLKEPRRVAWVMGFFLIAFSIAASIGLFKISHLLQRADSFRLTIWHQSWEIFKVQPWFGYGLGGKRPSIVFDYGIAAHSHNLFLSNMLDGGLFVLLFFLILIGYVLSITFSHYLDTGDLTLLAAMLFSCMVNLTDGKTLIVSPNHLWLYFWLPVGIVAALELRSLVQLFPSLVNARPSVSCKNSDSSFKGSGFP